MSRAFHLAHSAVLVGTVEGLEQRVSQRFGNEQRNAADPCICFLSVLCFPPRSLHPHPLYSHPWRDERRILHSSLDWLLWLLSISGPYCSDPLLNLVLLCPLSSDYAYIQAGVSPSPSPYLLYECHI